MLNLAIVGCGGMANWHAQQIQKIDQIRVVGLVDIVANKARDFGVKHKLEHAELFDSFESLLASPPAGLNGVLLVTPHTVHYAHAKAALEAGLDVMVEKPMVTSLEHAYDLWRTVNRTGRKLAITFQAPHTPEYQAIAALRDSGELGKVQIIQGWLAQGWLPNTKGTWRQDPALSGGGQMYDSGAHVLNGMMWLMNDPVVEVSCWYDRCGSPVDINGVAMLRFSNGAMGSVAIGGNCPGWDVAITLQSDIGVAKTGPHGGWLDMTRHGKKFYPPVRHDPHPAAGTAHLNFVRALAGEEPLASPVRYGCLLSALMDALYESAALGRAVKVEPVPASLD